MKFNTHFWLCFGASITLALTSCKKDEIEDPIIPNEEEVITTVNMTLTPTAGGSSITMSWQDLDGDGPDDAVIVVSDSLAINTVYSASLLLLNETESPADTINTEILDEALEHQFFFEISGLDASHSYADEDTDGNPLGLQNVIITGSASEGSIGIVLRHEPEKDAAGVAAGDISNADGETDIEVAFNVVIQ